MKEFPVNDYLFIYYLFIYSHLFKNTASASDSIIFWNDTLMLAFLKTSLLCKASAVFKESAPTTHSIQFLFSEYSTLPLSFVIYTKISFSNKTTFTYLTSTPVHT
jgi:hypothetical protein